MEGIPRATPLLMAFILWFCSLPIVLLLVVPLLGRAVAGPAGCKKDITVGRPFSND
ncbi:MAG: hypothetical protein M1598_01250 [Actinobacteria bacterium]|nr:hypothetical protein [Actinomycetota bacterium]